MENMNDIDEDLTRRFDSEELRREMEKMARANRAQTAARRAVERRENERRTGDRRVAERRTTGRRVSIEEMDFISNGISEGEVCRRPQQSRNGRRPAGKKTKSSGFKKGLIKYIA